MLLTHRRGRFAVHTLDNLIVVHHQASRTSLVYDIRTATDASSTGRYEENSAISETSSVSSLMELANSSCLMHNPLLADVSVDVCRGELSNYDEKQVALCGLTSNFMIINLLADSVNWVIFPRNVIIDAHIGCMWTIQLDLVKSIDCFKRDHVSKNCLGKLFQLKCLQFLLNRTSAKEILLNQLFTALLNRQLRLEHYSEVFESIVDMHTQANERKFVIHLFGCRIPQCCPRNSCPSPHRRPTLSTASIVLRSVRWQSNSANCTTRCCSRSSAVHPTTWRHSSRSFSR